MKESLCQYHLPFIETGVPRNSKFFHNNYKLEYLQVDMKYRTLNIITLYSRLTIEQKLIKRLKIILITLNSFL